MLNQVIMFAGVGISSGLVNMVVYNGVLLCLRLSGESHAFDFLIAQLLGFLINVAWGFWLNRRYVFTSEEERAIPWQKALLKVYISYAFTGIGLSSLLSLIWVYVFDVPKEVLTLLNDTLCFPVTFLLNKYWSFRKT